MMGHFICARNSKVFKIFLYFIYFQVLILFVLFLKGLYRNGLLHKVTFTKKAMQTETTELIRYSRNTTEHIRNYQDVMYPQSEINMDCTQRDNGRLLPFRPGESGRLEQWYQSIDQFFSITNTQPLDLPEDDGPNLYKDYDLKKPKTFTLSDYGNEEFTFENGKPKCFKSGTSKVLGKGSNVTCVCSSSYAGKHCSVPNIVKTALSKLSHSYIITPREKPRRIILVMTFNMEHHLLMLKMLQVHSAVDLFVILESNYTGHGDPRPLRLLHNLRRGYMKRFHHKIMHVYLDTFPAGGRANGWIVETYIRQQLAPAVETRVSGLRKDDLFVFIDTDETPSVNLLHFLKLHNGYPFPVGFVLQTFMFGFFWSSKMPTSVTAVSSIQMLRDVYKGSSDAIRGSKGVIRQLQKGSHPWGMFETWLIGSPDNYAGWHASWFSSPREVITKLNSAINADFPRWGDYPEKCTFAYVATLFRKGEYFDGKVKYDPICFDDIYVLKDISYLFKYKRYFNFMLQNPTAKGVIV
ncbi:beta-1,4-mannosyl-glycoprotein 4-beta-N-acetylglucosaminyltransferase-like [Haliotis rubra]|uniref:beta-1,4-mannosyl-glycoprotein 4-beta-N-acetylglucosaminyltransferase-like n=1 Tax=Haliotis rubra TaxID=36100 RepID=UPI001EE63571|nr:beta-1,4-mannosyl-glycoprotein 4-beta-N-acetylglucosaminyltransferase-like [Haliotis rubra]